MAQKSKLRIVFFGTPSFSTFVLDELESAGILPALIVTVPDKPADRGLLMKTSPVKVWGEERSIDVLQPERLDFSDPAADIILNSEWDIFIVAGYGKLLPSALLAIPKYGTLNVHPSLLPKFRGPSPIESQILTDAKEIGVSIILLDEETDHGPILAQASITPEPWPFRRNMVEDLLWHEGGKLLAESIPLVVDGSLKAEAQNHTEATFTPKLKKEDGLIDLTADAYQNYLKFCAYEGWPGTYFFVTRNGKEARIKIIDAKYEAGAFTPTRIIPEGKKEMDYADFLRS
ncbi:MAG: methionyl-tRNA formyltransferase [Parcubacteria group bacterium Greene0714_7]|nr:MAG: methionyl-tRNA formyltransferase [Parcubacteria group bacterium Greene0714_7]